MKLTPNQTPNQTLAQSSEEALLKKTPSLTFNQKYNDFEIEWTADGSPTLRCKFFDQERVSEKKPESMHHSKGALTETEYIYLKPFQEFLSQSTCTASTIAIVGLGLGYIDLFFLNELLKITSLNVKKNYHILSFEKNKDLIQKFTEWMYRSPHVVIKSDIYDSILIQINKNYSSSGADLERMKKLFQVNQNSNIQWQMADELNQNFNLQNLNLQNTTPFQFVAYDAFSQMTDHPLWTENFLDFFLSQMCDQNCVFTTYACTGVLKRTLQKNHFKFIRRNGFFGKRDATLAVRGSFIQHLERFQNV